MPATTVSHTTVRSVSVSSQDPPEKFLRLLARYQYLVEIEHDLDAGVDLSAPLPAAIANKDTTDDVIEAENSSNSDSDSDSSA